MSGETKHTPGPWVALQARTMTHIRDAEGHQVASVPRWPEGNARVMTAAPDLLEALRWTWMQLEAMREHCPEDARRSFEAGVEQARAAIAKAEGRQ